MRTSLHWAPLAVAVCALAACQTEKPINRDAEPPRVSQLDPQDGATNVSTLDPLTATFSESVVADTVRLRLRSGDVDIEGQTVLSEDGTNAVFTPATSLEEHAEFTFLVEGGYTDLAGNAGESASATFTTGGGAPTVTETTPADGAQNVPLDTPIGAVFSEAIDTSTLNEQTFFVTEGTNAVAGSVSWEDASHAAVFAPAKPLLEGRSYVATLTSEVADLSGNHLESAKTWSFTTLATVPTVVSVSPQNGAMAVPGNTVVNVEFSEAMDPESLTSETFRVTAEGQPIAGSYSWHAPSRIATFQPNGAFPGGATVEVELTAGITDASGIPLAQVVATSFTVSDAPSVVASTPVPNRADVALDATITLTFSEAMNVTTLNGNNIYLEGATVGLVDSTVIPTSTEVTLRPNAPLAESQKYTVVVTTNVRSATGVPFAAEYRFNFSTVGVPPSVIGVSPADKAQDVPVTAKARVTFSEPMDPATFTVANVRLSNGAADVVGTVTAIDPTTVEFTAASPLLERSSYTIIAGTGLTDVVGNALPSEFRSTFVTEPLPRIVAITPAANATNVPSGAAIVLVANKDLDPTTVTLTPATGMPVNTISLYEDGVITEAAVSYATSARAIRVTRTQNGAPAPWSPGKRYTLVAEGSKLKDMNGNPVGGTVTTTFIAGGAVDASAPQVSSVNPLNGQVGAPRTVRPSAFFSEPLDPTTLTASTVSLSAGTTPIAGRIEYVAAERKVVFVPDALLSAGTQFTFSLGAGIKDLSGNSKGVLNSVTFSTETNSAPQLTGVSPLDGATNIDVNRAIRLSFDEPIDPNTLDVQVAAANGAIAGTVAYDASTRSATFRPAAALPSGATVTVTVASGLEDAEGLGTTSDIVRSFSTVSNGANDVLAPSVSTTLPANGATGVSARLTIQVRFSEAIDPTTVAVDQFILKEVGGNRVPFGVRFDVASDTALLTPSIPLSPAAAYELKVLGGIEDLAGNAVDAMAASSTIAFTVDGQSPTVTARSPAPNSTVGSSAGVELTFSEAMNPATLDASSLRLTAGGMPVLAAVWYDEGTRTLFLRPAARLPDASYTVTLDGSRAADLAGNTVADTFGFTVSSAGPSVVSATPCGSIVDVDDLGSLTATITFDPGVKKTGGGALDSSAVQLRHNGSVVAASVSHAAGSTTATLTPSAPLQHDTVYELFVNKAQVQNATTSANMTADYSCSFRTQKTVFDDDLDPAADTGWVQTGNNTSNRWQATNSSDDPSNGTNVWRGGSFNDGQNYTRPCGLGAQSQNITIERDVNLGGLSNAEVRLDLWEDIAQAGGDYGQLAVLHNGTETVLETFTGSNQPSYQNRRHALDGYVGASIKLRLRLHIQAGSPLSCPATKKGLFVDNVKVVGQ